MALKLEEMVKKNLREDGWEISEDSSFLILRKKSKTKVWHAQIFYDKEKNRCYYVVYDPLKREKNMREGRELSEPKFEEQGSIVPTQMFIEGLVARLNNQYLLQF